MLNVKYMYCKLLYSTCKRYQENVYMSKVAQCIQVKIHVCVGGEKIHVTFSQMECAYSHQNARMIVHEGFTHTRSRSIKS